jgi:RNA polymerase sigma-70 factor (sigma-E family)
MDETAFMELVPVLGRRLRRTAFLMCGSWPAAEDAAQEALVRLYLALPRIERKGGIASYARRCVVSSVLDQAKRPWRRESPSLYAQPDRPGLVDLESVVDERAVMVAALRTLAPRQRACVVLRYYDELSVRQVADALGISEGTVKSQTSKGLDNLRAALSQPATSETGGER